MTEYTDKQLGYVLINSDYDRRLTVSDLRDILEALPNQQDDWQACEFSEIRKGDRVRSVANHDNGTTSILEGVVWEVDDYNAWDIDGYRALAVATERRDITLYRIPAPVQHPDPDEHPVIMEQGGKGWVWNAQFEMYHQPHSAQYRFPDSFTEWSPAQIITDEPMEAPR